MTNVAEASEPGQTHLVQILVNNREVEVPKNTTGAGIKTAAGVPSDYQLFRIAGHEEILVGDTEQIEVHNKEAFAATPSIEPA
jgi:hypothetical protein